jgi:hypothetical protein
MIVAVLEPLLHSGDIERHTTHGCCSLWGLQVSSRIGIGTAWWQEWYIWIHAHMRIMNHGWHYPRHSVVQGRMSAIRWLVWIGNVGCRSCRIVVAVTCATARPICKCIDSGRLFINTCFSSVLYCVQQH